MFSANLQSLKHYVLSFQVDYKSNVLLESLFVFIVYLFPTASS